MKILVIGSAGFIGRHLCDLLSNLKYKYDEFDLLYGQDMRNKYQLDTQFLIGNYDTVILLAAFTGVPRSKEYYSEYFENNIIGTANVLKMCEKYKVKNFIFFSSSSVYGGCKDKNTPLKESDVCSPISYYGASKVCGESLVKMSNMNWCIIRPFAVYSENYGKKFSVIYRWINQIKNNRKVSYYGSGNSCRGYTYCPELAKTTIDVVELMSNINCSGKKFNEIINLGGSEIIKLSDMWSIFEKFCQKYKIPCEREMLPQADYDISYSFADILKAKKLLGFNPKHNFKKNLKNILVKELL